MSQTLGNRDTPGGFGRDSPRPPVLAQNSRRAIQQDYKPIALRVGLQFVGRTPLPCSEFGHLGKRQLACRRSRWIC
jgi:hypothetical protein